MKLITTSVYTFEHMIEGEFVYVDKTGIIREMIRPKFAQYFMARPRRFGKSLTISTLAAIFEGRRELFKGLAIERSDYEWDTFPVLRLDLSTCQSDKIEDLRSNLDNKLNILIHDLKLEVSPANTIEAKFENVCNAAAAKSKSGKFVLLIDEYDKPLLGKLGKPEVEKFRMFLKSFYSVIKATEAKQRFTFITGVSKFSKVSIFSDLNNLTDLTLDARVATLCGYTHDEVLANFDEHLAALGKANGMSKDEVFAKVLKWYNGYRFHPACETVVNPVSMGRCFDTREFNNFWYETGTPTFLINELKKNPLDMTNLEIQSEELGTYEPSNPALIPLLFQTGYLTIKSMRKTEDGDSLYTLGFPNNEVTMSFSKSLAKVYTQMDDVSFVRAKIQCADALSEHDMDTFFKTLPVFFANLPYDLTDRQNEQTWQAILVIILNFLGFRVFPEERTNLGRIDMVMETRKTIYIIEMKLDKTAEDALSQIKEKGYAEKYRACGKRITLIGMNFSSAARTIDKWLVEDVA